MPKRATATPWPELELAASAAAPLARQLEDGLRGAILAGDLPPGARLPSTRALAARLAVSRTTVVAAFDRLLAEGYLTGRVGSGTYVARAIVRPRSAPPAAAGLSRRGAVIARTRVAGGRGEGPPVPFRTGVPALERFPADVWSALADARLRGMSTLAAGYPDPAGHPALRAAISAYLTAERSVRCAPDQVVIVNGSQQAIDVAARVLLDPGDAALVEDPGYPGARAALVAAGARIVPQPVDQEGMVVPRGRARLVYVTPSHQYPLGVTMSLPRRLALLDWAAAAGAFVLEDDYDSEFRYSGRPLAALQGLDAAGRVIYIGTFSKVLFPALRIGYLVAPSALVPAFTAAVALAGRGSPPAPQAVLADFMTQGHFGRHIRRTRQLYAERQAALVAASRQQFGGLLDIGPAPAGMHLLGWLPAGADDRAAAARAAAAGVEAIPLTALAAAPQARGALILGYTGFDAAAIAAGVRRQADALGGR